MYAVSLLTALALSAAPPVADSLAAQVRALADRVPQPDQAAVLRDVREQLYQSGLRESAAWNKLSSQKDWQAYRDPRLQALRDSLGQFPAPPRDLRIRVRKTINGDGYHVDCLTYDSRPGVVVTANLYRPATAPKASPGILIVHSHHNPKTEGELQDMGVLWAKAGAYVLVMDQLGHGERRHHPFRTQKDYPATFRPSRQDYYFRYNAAMQLQTIGDGLMGWMVWDQMRGIDLLLSRPGIDAKKIAILGSVAGGGDPCSVTAALDERIAAAVPFNFGGPQPETRYPLPDDPELSFLYSGSGSWESTRNLYLSAKQGFLPWVITGAIAPRRHVYAHEFAWDDKRDPVWRRLQKIHQWHGTADHLASVKGRGAVTGKAPEATHCNNIGEVHRQGGIHEAFARWFGLKVEDRGPRERRAWEELHCLAKDETLPPLHDVAGRLGEERASAARARLAALPADKRRAALQAEWKRLLGAVDPGEASKVLPQEWPTLDGNVLPRWVRLSDKGHVGALVLAAAKPKEGRRARVMVAQGGPRSMLRGRGGEIADWLRQGDVVVLAALGGLKGYPRSQDSPQVLEKEGR